jgi:hypothetical protein
VGRTPGSAPTFATASAGKPAERHRAVLQQHCAGGHDSRTETAGPALDRLDIDNVSAHAATWEKTAHQRAGIAKWSATPRTQHKRMITFLRSVLADLEVASRS